MSARQKEPILILGMHRSGTSMIARVLDRLGLFLGRSKEHNHEAWLTLKLNDWLLAQCGGRWDNPEPIDYLLDNPQVRQHTTRFLGDMLAGPKAISFMGLWRYLRYRRPSAMGRPWGWKDPRTTFTLPIWLDLFGDARIIHVRRHGVDVAASIMTRQTTSFAAACDKYAKFRLAYALKSKPGGFADSVRIRSLDNAVDLWDRYVRRADTHVAQLGDNALDLRYENFLTDPAAEAARLADFCGLSTTAEQIAAATDDVRADRAYAFARDNELAAFAKTVDDRLAPHGYTAAGGAGQS